jgi:hypothetical protein
MSVLGELRLMPVKVKDSHTRIKPLALASSHGRYIAVTPGTCVRWGMAVTYNRDNFFTASLQKRS